MPIRLNQAQLSIKDENGHYIGINTIAEKLTAQQITDIQNTANAKKVEMQAIKDAMQTSAQGYVNLMYSGSQPGFPQYYATVQELDEHIIEISSEQPTSQANKLWINNGDVEEVQLSTIEDLNNIIAPEYSDSETYDVGDYCIKDGYMYRCKTAISTAEVWTAAHWTQVTTGAEVSDLKSAFDKSLYGLVNVKFVANKYVNPSTGAYITSTGAKAIEYVSCLPDEVIIINAPVSSAYGAWYNSNKERIASLSLNSGEGYIKAPSNAYYFATSTLNDDIDGIQIYTNIGVRLKELTDTVNSFGETKVYSVGQKDVKSLNLFDASLVTEGYYLNGSSGTPVQNATYGYTDYIPLSGDKYEYPSALQNTSIYFYDANKALLAPAARAMKNYDMASTWPVGTKYCRFNVTVATMDSIVFQTSVNTGYYISSSQVVDNVYNIQVGSTRDYKTIKSAIDYINHIADEDATYNILLDAGTYNALDGFDLSQQDSTFSGIILPNNTYIIGQGNADDVVIAVDGTNFPSNISNNEVSTLNMYRNNGLKNVTIKSKNIRYGLHDDDAYRATNPVNGAVQAFENVKFINEPHTVSGVASYCVGIGMKRGETLKFIRCEFENQDTTYCAIGFHNGTTGLTPTTYEFDSCKVAANGTYGFRLTTTAYNVVDRVIFKGCKSNKNLLLDKASGYTDTKTSFKIFGYGNVGITVSTDGIELNTEDTEMLIS